MPSETHPPSSPGLFTFLKSLKSHPADSSVEHLVLLLKRRQVRGSRPSAVAVTHLYLAVVAEAKPQSIAGLLDRIRSIGRRLNAAQPRELVIGNIVRRVLGLVREVNETQQDPDRDVLDSTIKPPSQPLSVAENRPPASSNGDPSMQDVKQDVLNGLREMLDELDQADEQVAGYALDHVYANQTILTYTSSLTVQRFLLTAAKRRKFTVIQIEAYPNEHHETYETLSTGKTKRDAEDNSQDNRLKTLTSAGIDVILAPDSAAYAIMSRVDLVLLPMHIALPNGAFIGAAGCQIIAQAAKAHRVPVLTLGAIYKLSPLHPYDPASLVEMGSATQILDYRDGELVKEVEAINPISDYVPPDLVASYVTNIGPFPPSFMYRVAADHYRNEDLDI